jgi:hypothetical protein
MIERDTPLKYWTKIEQLRWIMLAAELWQFALKIDGEAKRGALRMQRRPIEPHHKKVPELGSVTAIARRPERPPSRCPLLSLASPLNMRSEAANDDDKSAVVIEFENILSSKIKGRGTTAPVRACLHISFHSTSFWTLRAESLLSAFQLITFCVPDARSSPMRRTWGISAQSRHVRRRAA